MSYLLLAFAGVAGAILFGVIPPIPQDPAYHAFADRRTILGVPNFWNVVSNAAFLAVALYGAWRIRAATCKASWAMLIVIAGTAAVSVGSAYYHLRPTTEALFWDRLPMAVVFMSVLSVAIGEFIDFEAGKRLLPLLVALGAGSVMIWRFGGGGDLRLYGFVQFGSIAVIVALLAMRKPVGEGHGTARAFWWMLALYGVAKALESLDGALLRLDVATGGHPWKHVVSAAALLDFVHHFTGRQQRARE